MFEQEGQKIAEAAVDYTLTTEALDIDYVYQHAAHAITHALTAAYERGKHDALKVEWRAIPGESSAWFCRAFNVGVVWSRLDGGWLCRLYFGDGGTFGPYLTESAARAAVEAAFRGGGN